MKMSSLSMHFVVAKLHVGRPENSDSIRVKCGFFLQLTSRPEKCRCNLTYS
jgi:hypothetical protein